MGPWLIDSDKPLARTRQRLLTGYLCAYSRLALAPANADALGLPDAKAFQATVAVSAQ